MSIALVVEWANGKVDHVHIASHAASTQVWRRIGIENGMKWVPLFYSSLVIDREILDEVADEVMKMASIFAVSAEFKSEWDLENAQHLIALLERLKLEEGWNASIG